MATATQKWGSTSLKIDPDVVDGLVYPTSVSKNYAFAEQDIQFPGADSSGFGGMNNSYFYGATTNTAVGIEEVYTPTFMAFGTLYNNSAFSGATLAYPASNVYYTQPWAINNQNIVVGWYFTTTDGNTHGFSYDVVHNTYKPIDYPGATYTAPTGINDAGWIVGTTGVGSSGYQCFLLKGTTYTVWNPPGSYPNCWGINGTGEIVGFDGGSSSFGYLYDAQSGNPASGSMQTITRSGGDITGVTGINNNGLIAGYGTTSADSFLLNDGIWTSLLTGTGGQANGINDNAQITGQVQPASRPPQQQGFILSPSH